MTKNERVLQFLQNGNTLTEAQARHMFGVANLSAEASRLREKGYAVYRNLRTNSKGEQRSVFRLGTPRRAVVAAGFRALGVAA